MPTWKLKSTHAIRSISKYHSRYIIYAEKFYGPPSTKFETIVLHKHKESVYDNLKMIAVINNG